jgi:predicted transcriptional regulator
VITPKIDLRAEQELINRIDALAMRMSRPGALVSRSAAARLALFRGLDAIEAEEVKPARRPVATRTK